MAEVHRGMGAGSRHQTAHLLPLSRLHACVLLKQPLLLHWPVADEVPHPPLPLPQLRDRNTMLSVPGRSFRKVTRGARLVLFGNPLLLCDAGTANMVPAAACGSRACSLLRPCLLPPTGLQVLTILSQAQREQQAKEHAEKMRAKQHAATHKVGAGGCGIHAASSARHSLLAAPCLLLTRVPMCMCFSLATLPRPCSLPSRSRRCRCGPRVGTSARRSRTRR